MIDAADNNAVYYYHFDGLGSVIALSDANSEIVERYSYDVFGEPNRTSDVNNPYLFTGRRYDPEAGLYYYRARYYDYYTGRFLQPDPIGYDDGMNLYTSVANNPISLVDPDGSSAASALARMGLEMKTGIRTAEIRYNTEDGKSHHDIIASAHTIKHVFMQAKISGNRITYFEYVGHSFEGGYGLDIGPEGGGLVVNEAGGSYGAVVTTGDIANLTQDAFAPGAVIKLEGCYSAQATDLSQNIAQFFKQMVPDSKVYGYTGFSGRLFWPFQMATFPVSIDVWQSPHFSDSEYIEVQIGVIPQEEGKQKQ